MYNNAIWLINSFNFVFLILFTYLFTLFTYLPLFNTDQCLYSFFWNLLTKYYLYLFIRSFKKWFMTFSTQLVKICVSDSIPSWECKAFFNCLIFASASHREYNLKYEIWNKTMLINKPFAWWHHFTTTTTRIPQCFVFFADYIGLLLFLNLTGISKFKNERKTKWIMVLVTSKNTSSCKWPISCWCNFIMKSVIFFFYFLFFIFYWKGL